MHGHGSRLVVAGDALSAADRIMAQAPVSTVGRLATRSRLRVLAMHGVPDVVAFDEQVRRLLRWFRPVDAGRVDQWFHEGRELPPDAIWFTFDDGERSTVVDGATVLHRHGVPATVFVCPGLVAEASPPWWATVSSATAMGEVVTVDGRELRGQAAVTALKRVPDRVRRETVARLRARSDSRGAVDEGADRVTVEDLHRWRELGGDIGNHTWDHPCLDRCDPDEQRRQIDLGTAWLDEHGLWERRIFAYPNGDRTDVAEGHLDDEGYRLVALFDHRLASRRSGALRVSRLRLDAAASEVRTAAVTSAWHSGLFSMRTRLTRRG